MQQKLDRATTDQAERPGFSMELVRSKVRGVVSGDYLYPFFIANGLQYGPSFALLSTVWLASNVADQPYCDTAVGNVDNVLPTEDRGFRLCPAVLDASLQVGAARGMCSVQVPSDGKDGSESSTFVPAGFHALHSNGCMRGFQYQALSVYDSASSTATHKETHYKVHGASQNFDLCINGLIAKSLKTNVADQMKTVHVVPDSIQYRLQWQAEKSSELPTATRFGRLNQFAYRDCFSAGDIPEVRLCMEAISTVQTISEVRSHSMSLFTQGGVSAGVDIVQDRQMQASLLWGIVKSVAASGSTFSSVRDVYSTAESQNAGLHCHFNLWDTKSDADVANMHSGTVLKGGLYYDSRLLQVPEVPMTRAKYQISPQPRGSLTNMVVEFTTESFHVFELVS